MNALAHYYAAAASAFHEIFYHKFPGIFRRIIPEKYRYFSGNCQKNSAGNFWKFPEISEHPTLVLLLFEC